LSLILDALNRSRGDADPVPGLATRHYVDAASDGPWRRYLPWAALAAALVLIAWLLLDRAERADAPADVTGVEEVSRNVSSALTAVQSELRARAALSTPDTPESVDRMPAAAADPAPAPAAPRQVAPSLQAAPVSSAPEAPPPTADSEVAALYAQPLQETQPEPAPPPTPAEESSPVDIEQVLAMAQQEMGNTGMVEHPAPFLSSLSQQTKDTIPTIFYQGHDFAERGGASVVMNGKTLRAGGSPASGVRIDEILPDSAVLSFRGTQFRLRALNSWVNL